MEKTYWEWVDRNLGVITREEQLKLRNSTVALSGCGGMGGTVAVCLARIGVGRIKIADPESFDFSNGNRQYAARLGSIGKNKALSTYEEIYRITKDMTQVDVYPDGVNAENVESLVRDADVVLDESEFYRHVPRILLHQAARRFKKNVLNCNVVGFGTRIFLFTPTSMTIEEFLEADLDTELSPELIGRLISRLAPELPADIASEVLRNWVLNPNPSQRKVPIFGATPLISSGILAVRAVLEILGTESRPWIEPIPEMPGYAFFDAGVFRAGVHHGKWW